MYVSKSFSFSAPRSRDRTCQVAQEHQRGAIAADCRCTLTGTQSGRLARAVREHYHGIKCAGTSPPNEPPTNFQSNTAASQEHLQMRGMAGRMHCGNEADLATNAPRWDAHEHMQPGRSESMLAENTGCCRVRGWDGVLGRRGKTPKR